jgi:hypothetical protein
MLKSIVNNGILSKITRKEFFIYAFGTALGMIPFMSLSKDKDVIVPSDDEDSEFTEVDANGQLNIKDAGAIGGW